jgi:2-oxoglutarate dehydrogenase E2 component (dihydrolipoamide succinyltransferase)
MALVELIMPKMGESIVEATVLSWLKKPGDKIELEESLLEVATDKVDTEIPSTHAGVLKEVLAKVGELVKVGAPIAILDAEVEDVKVSNEPTEPHKPAAKPDTHEIPVSAEGHSNGNQRNSGFQVIFEISFTTGEKHCP